MSELFESLQFPLAPSSSPTATISCPLQDVSGSSRGNQSNTRTGELAQNKNISKGSLNHLHHQQHPRTPLSKANAASSSTTRTSTSTSHFHDEQTTNTTPSFASTSTSRLHRPGHVFWHATPSPSQQVRHNEWQKHMSSNTSPTLPLGTQAFRQELLDQGASSAASKSRQVLTAGRLSDRSFSASHRSPCTAATSVASTSTIGRKFSRRISRKSAVSVGDASISDKSQGGEGMQQLLADLNQHLQNHENEVDDAEEESLVEELDRVFSSQRDISDSPAEQLKMVDGQNDSRQMTGVEVIERQPRIAPDIQPSPQNSREWSRVKSAPTVTSSPRQQGRMSMAKVHSAKEGLKARPNLIKRALSPSPNPRSTDSDCSAEEDRCSASPTKTILGKGSESSKHLTRGKTRSSVSPPKKWDGRRTPRIGLSRHSIGASQVSSSLQSGPAAPFKRPTKASHIISQKKATTKKEIIVIDDSDEDVIRQQQATQPTRRTSPRKKTGNQPQSVKLPARSENKKEDMDEDTSFDISMDESMLCEAADQAEARASQEALQASQRGAKKSPPVRLPSIGDDSFEMGSSDNEAILSAMEAQGW
jgi:hypothetical protein